MARLNETLGRPAARVLASELADVLRVIKSLFDPYHPERHYMRGPGPKWRAKHGGAAAAAHPTPGLFHVEALKSEISSRCPREIGGVNFGGGFGGTHLVGSFGAAHLGGQAFGRAFVGPNFAAARGHFDHDRGFGQHCDHDRRLVRGYGYGPD
jgi:hypothetical protein